MIKKRKNVIPTLMNMVTVTLTTIITVMKKKNIQLFLS